MTHDSKACFSCKAGNSRPVDAQWNQTTIPTDNPWENTVCEGWQRNAHNYNPLFNLKTNGAFQLILGWDSSSCNLKPSLVMLLLVGIFLFKVILRLLWLNKLLTGICLAELWHDTHVSLHSSDVKRKHHDGRLSCYYYQLFLQ